MTDQVAPGAGITINKYGTSTYATFVNQVIDKQLHKEALAASFWNNFTGEIDQYGRVPNSVVIRKNDLRKEGGDIIKIPMKNNPSPTWKDGDSVLIGNEAKQALYYLKVWVNQRRAAVAGPKGMANQRVKMLNLRMQMKDDVARMWARNYDDEHYRAICEGYSANLTGANGIATTAVHPAVWGVGEAAVTSSHAGVAALVTNSLLAGTDVVDWDALDAWKTHAKTQKIVPISTAGGEGLYVVVLHPYCMYDLQQASTQKWREYVKDAAPRGKGNDFYTGSLVGYNGLGIKEHLYCPSVTTVAGVAASVVTCQYGYGAAADDYDVKTVPILGQSAVGFGIATELYYEDENYDYKNAPALAGISIYGTARGVWTDDASNAVTINQSSLLGLAHGVAPTI